MSRTQPRCDRETRARARSSLESGRTGVFYIFYWSIWKWTVSPFTLPEWYARFVHRVDCISYVSAASVWLVLVFTIMKLAGYLRKWAFQRAMWDAVEAVVGEGWSCIDHELRHLYDNCDEISFLRDSGHWFLCINYCRIPNFMFFVNEILFSLLFYIYVMAPNHACCLVEWIYFWRGVNEHITSYTGYDEPCMKEVLDQFTFIRTLCKYPIDLFLISIKMLSNYKPSYF